MANTTWNPSDLSGVALSDGNLTAKPTSSLGAGVRAVDRQRSGKYYWEVTATAWNAAQDQIGVGISSAPLNSATPAGTCLLQKGGTIFVSNVTTGVTLGARAAGDIIGIALDCDGRQIWFRVAPSGNWNGNAGFAPGGTGGISLLSAFGIANIYPELNFISGASSCTFTANFGDTAFSGTVPSGYTSGFPAPSAADVAGITQEVLEHWTSNGDAQITQLALEHWVNPSSGNVQAVMTQIALEHWTSVADAGSGGGSNTRAMILA